MVDAFDADRVGLSTLAGIAILLGFVIGSYVFFSGLSRKSCEYVSILASTRVGVPTLIASGASELIATSVRRTCAWTAPAVGFLGSDEQTLCTGRAPPTRDVERSSLQAAARLLQGAVSVARGFVRVLERRVKRLVIDAEELVRGPLLPVHTPGGSPGLRRPPSAKADGAMRSAPLSGLGTRSVRVQMVPHSAGQKVDRLGTRESGGTADGQSGISVNDRERTPPKDHSFCGGRWSPEGASLPPVTDSQGRGPGDRRMPCGARPSNKSLYRAGPAPVAPSATPV
jgi:hypothetical protein